jgi:hypothetical protein
MDYAILFAMLMVWYEIRLLRGGFNGVKRLFRRTIKGRNERDFM